MTEPIPATPGWTDARLQAIFAKLPVGSEAAGNAFAECLASRKAPAAPSDLLGAEFEPCHLALRRDLLRAGVDRELIETVGRELEAFEAELAAQS